MPAIFTFHHLAAAEFRSARTWYSRRSKLTARKFVAAVDAVLERIAHSPESLPTYDDRHRWVKLKKFPYVLIFQIRSPQHIIVVAVAHTRRRQGYWKRRTF